MLYAIFVSCFAVWFEKPYALCPMRYASVVIAVRGKCAGHFSGFQRLTGIQLQFSFFEDNGFLRNDH